MKKRVLFISSTGGHLTELLQLESLFDKYDYRIITEKTPTNIALKKTYGKKISFVIYGTKDHKFTYGFKLLANCFIELWNFIKFRPKVIVTTGAHIAGPMCCIGKINTKTITGKLVYKFADLFLVQWEDMLNLYPKAKYYGNVFGGEK